MILFCFIKYYLFYLKYKTKRRRGGSGFPLPPPPMRVKITLPTLRLDGVQSVGFTLTS